MALGMNLYIQYEYVTEEPNGLQWYGSKQYIFSSPSLLLSQVSTIPSSKIRFTPLITFFFFMKKCLWNPLWLSEELNQGVLWYYINCLIIQQIILLNIHASGVGLNIWPLQERVKAVINCSSSSPLSSSLSSASDTSTTILIIIIITSPSSPSSTPSRDDKKDSYPRLVQTCIQTSPFWVHHCLLLTHCRLSPHLTYTFKNHLGLKGEIHCLLTATFKRDSYGPNPSLAHTKWSKFHDSFDLILCPVLASVVTYIFMTKPPPTFGLMLLTHDTFH